MKGEKISKKAEELYFEIMSLHDDGATRGEIAERLGIHWQTVGLHLRGAHACHARVNGERHENRPQLKPEVVAKIKEMLMDKNGPMMKEIAAACGRSVGAISAINKGTIWYDSANSYPLRKKYQKNRK